MTVRTTREQKQRVYITTQNLFKNEPDGLIEVKHRVFDSCSYKRSNHDKIANTAQQERNFKGAMSELCFLKKVPRAASFITHKLLV